MHSCRFLGWFLNLRALGLVFLFAAFLTLPDSRPASAHSLTFVSTSLQQACLGAGQTTSTLVYDHQAPTDRTWNIRLQIFLANGDRYQDARFNGWVKDNAIPLVTVAFFKHALRDWVVPGSAKFVSTMQTHVGSSFDLRADITNVDSSSQCFWVWGDAGYE